MKNIRIVNNELLIYINKNDVENVTDVFTNLKFNLIDRVYKLHVSTTDKDTFIETFGDVNYETSPASNENRFIVSITTDNFDEYNRLLTVGNDSNNKCRVRPFRNIHVNNDQREPRDQRDQRDQRDNRGPRVYRDNRTDNRDNREQRGPRDNRADNREQREPRVQNRPQSANPRVRANRSNQATRQ